MEVVVEVVVEVIIVRVKEGMLLGLGENENERQPVVVDWRFMGRYDEFIHITSHVTSHHITSCHVISYHHRTALHCDNLIYLY